MSNKPSPNRCRVISSSALAAICLLSAGHAGAAPSITTQPAAAAVPAGNSAALKVSATGGSLTYQWYRGNSGDTTSPVAGGVGALLVSQPVRAAATFWVRVSDATGSTDSSAAAVTLRAPFPTRLLAVGGNSYGQLGNGSGTSSTTPTQTASRVVQVAANSTNSYFIRDNGELWGSGNNSYGQLGDASPSTHFTQALIASQAKGVTAGSGSLLFVKSDNTLWGAGSNASGQLGDGTNLSHTTPVQVATGVAAASSRYLHSLFLKTDGTLWTTGYNNYGQLGDGTKANRIVPVQLADSVAMAAAGQYHSLFLKTDGTLWSTGYNFYGQLGDGTTTERSVPAQVASGVAYVVAGDLCSFFIRTDGSLWAVGNNDYGNLGTGNKNPVPSPVKVAEGVKSVVSGNYQTFFLKTDDTLWAMGRNSDGQFGDGTTTERLTPVQVASATAAVAAGNLHSLILDLRPAIDTQPADKGVVAGTAATLSVTVSGGPAFSYQWYAGASGNTSSPVPGATYEKHQTPAVTGVGSYWVRVTNPYGTADSRAASVQTVTQPAINSLPQATAVSQGDNASLVVSASGGGLVYQWFQGLSGDTSQPVAGATGPLLVTPSLVGSGNYWVRISNAAGSIDSATAVVTVSPRTPGYLRSVGSTDFGQLGTGAMAANFTPAPIATGVAKVSSGGDHSLILKTDGSLWTIGLNNFGQLGDGSTTSRSVPFQLTNGGVTWISAGPNFSLFVKTSGSLWIMGYGNGSTPKQIATGVSMAWGGGPAGIYYLTTDGVLMSKPLTSTSTSGTVVATGVVNASAGYKHVLYIKTDGTLWGTGTNSLGELGFGTSVPTQIASGVTKAAAGTNTSYFVKTDGTLWGLGDNSSGQLADSTVGTKCGYPISMDTRVADVAANGGHVVYLKTDGSLWGAGLNSSGQLGDGTAAPRSIPVVIKRRVSQACAGAAATLFVTTDGTLWGTGSNKYGQLGDSMTPAGSPSAQVTDNVIAMSAGGSHSLLIKSDGSLWASGSNASGQINGTFSSYATPVQVATGVASAAAGEAYSLFVKSDGSLWAMGKNDQGQLGDGFTKDRNYPVSVASDVSCAAAGTSHSLFIKTDGTLWAMGDNTYGQLGDASNSDRVLPVQVASNVVMAAVGRYHSLFLKNDGSLWAMGRNLSGELGDGTNVDRYAPVRIATGVTQVTAGSSYGHFLKSDRTLWSMGQNYFGQLGVTENAANYTPMQVATSVAAVEAGGEHSLFIKTNKTLWAMGRNSDYQLGDGTKVSGPTPVQIASGVSLASAGNSHSLWLTSNAGSAAAAIASRTEVFSWQSSGERAVISATAAGSGTLTYQWYAGLSGDTSQPVAGATSPSFSTPLTTSSAFYWLQVTGPSNSVNSRTTGIRGLAVPTITVQPAVVGVLANGAVRLSVTGSATTYSYQWYSGPNTKGGTAIAGATSSTLITQPIKTTTSFTVRLLNSAGYTESVQTVVTVPPPTPAGRNLKMAGSSFGVIAQRDGAVVSASVGDSHCLYVKTSGTLWAKGSNSYGQFGNGTTSPLPVSSSFRVSEKVASSAAGSTHSLFIKTDGTLWAMGSNYYGQLGDGTNVTRTSPVLIASNVASVAAGSMSSFFVKTDGTLWAMGQYFSRTPAQIATSVSQVAAGARHFLFIKTDGSLWGRGSNSDGQLGLGSSSWISSAFKIADGVAAVAAGDSHSLFLTSDGVLRGMGRSSSGQLGYGATDSEWAGSYQFPSGTLVPRIIATNVATMAAGAVHSLWTGYDGSLWSTGSNESRQLCTTQSDYGRKPPAKVQDRIGPVYAAGSNSVILSTDATIEPPGIVVHPVGKIVESGKTATFQVSATGAATLSYQWYAGETGDRTQPISGATAATYVSPSLNAPLTVWVKVSNAAAYAESSTATAAVGVSSQGYWQWAASQTLDGSKVLPSSDPDGDGRGNLLEYLAGSSPLAGDAPPAIKALRDLPNKRTDFQLTLRGDPDLRLACMISPDFVSWQSAPLSYQNGVWTSGSPLVKVVSATSAGGGMWNLTLRYGDSPKSLFMKISAEVAPGG